jgi:hypothetical protein
LNRSPLALSHALTYLPYDVALKEPGTMSEERHKRRVGARVRHHRRARFALLCVGTVGALLGLMILVGSRFVAEPSGALRRIGAAYLLAALAVFGVRWAIGAWSDWQRARYSRPAWDRSAGHPKVAAPRPRPEDGSRPDAAGRV